LYMKKWLALVLILILAVGMLSGCSPIEKNYYSLLMEINSQKVYTDSGSFQINLSQLPTSTVAAGEGAFDQAVLMKAVNQNRIDYVGKVDMNQKVMQYDLTIVNISTNARTPLLTITAKDGLFYLKIDDLIKYLGQFCSPAEKQKLAQTLGDVVWVSLSNQDLNAMMPEGSQPVFMGDLFQMSTNQQTVWKRLFDGLVNDAYKDYQSGLITQSNNQYTLTIRGAELMNIVKPAVIYTINHSDEVGVVLKTFLKSLTTDELGTLGLTEAMQAELLQGLDMLVQNVNQNRPQILSEVEDMGPTAAQEMMKTLNDSQMVASLEKIDPMTFRQDNRLHVHISSGDPIETIEFTLSQLNTMKIGGTIGVTSPSGMVITLTELKNRMPDQVGINVDSGVYHSNNGFISSNGTMEVHLLDNYTYLPLRLIGESLGEKVGWDQAAHQAYVEQSGQRIYMTSLYFNERAFIKIRDFERLGYTVTWDPVSRMANIAK